MNNNGGIAALIMVVILLLCCCICCMCCWGFSLIGSFSSDRNYDYYGDQFPLEKSEIRVDKVVESKTTENEFILTLTVTNTGERQTSPGEHVYLLVDAGYYYPYINNDLSLSEDLMLSLISPGETVTGKLTFNFSTAKNIDSIVLYVKDSSGVTTQTISVL